MQIVKTKQLNKDKTKKRLEYSIVIVFKDSFSKLITFSKYKPARAKFD